MTSPRHLREQDASFDRFLDQALVETEDTELTPAKRKERRAAADADPLAFCRTYFPGIFDLPWAAFHHEMAGLTEGTWYVDAARRYGKSAVAFIGHGVRRVAMGRDLGPTVVAVLMRTDDKARARTSSLSRLVQRNRLLCYDYDVEVEKDEAGWHVINGVHLVAASYKMGLRGLLTDEFNRIGLAISDDLWDRTSVSSEADNERIVQFLEGEVRGQMEPGALHVVLGNAISATCPIVVLRERYPDRSISCPALDEDDESTWPEAYSTEYWHGVRAETPLDVWSGEYQCRPLLVGEVFDLDWVRTVNVNLLEVLGLVTAIDPSHGSSPLACLKAAAEVGLVSDGSTFLSDLYARTDPFDDLFDYLAERQDRWGGMLRAFLWENDFEQWNHAAPWYQVWSERTGRVLPVVTHYSRQLRSEYYGSDKDGRILNLLHPYKTGRHVHSDAIPAGADYDRWRAAYVGFGKSRKKGQQLDPLDAEATAFLMVRGYLRGHTAVAAVPRKRTFRRPSWDGLR